MAKKKKKEKPVLGDNPFGDISSIEVPAKRRKSPVAGRKKKKEKASSPERIIGEAERKIDEVLETISQKEEAAEGLQNALVDFASRMQSKMAVIQVEAGEETRALGTLFKLVRPSFYMRKILPLILAGRGVQTDEFGMDATFEGNVKPLVKLVYEKYFRITVEGLENIPPSGGCIVVANHAPVLSLDGIMIRHSITNRVRSDVRWLMENELFYIPYVGTFAQRIGAVRASQENASFLLNRDALIITFPEGVQGISRTFRERYKLKRFGRGGYIRLAIRHSVPVIPAAIAGPQDSFPILCKVSAGAQQVSLPFIPITPTFPLLGPLGLIPLPLKWKIRFGSPLKLDDSEKKKQDHATINKLNNSVRDTIQHMINELRKT